MLRERGIHVSHESLREWNQKFAAQIALEIKVRRAASGKTCLDHKMHLAGMVAGIWMKCMSSCEAK
jgi:transposase-like protein